MRPRAIEKGSRMIDPCVQLTQPNLHLQIGRALTLQRQIVDDWHQSMDAWRTRRVQSVGATLDLASALSSARSPQAAIEPWALWYTGFVARWAEDLAESYQLGQKTMDRLLSVQPGRSATVAETAQPGAVSDSSARQRPGATDHAIDRWRLEQQSAHHEAA